MKTQPSFVPFLIPCIPPKAIERIPRWILIVYFIITLPFYCIITCFVLTFMSFLRPWIQATMYKRDKKRKLIENEQAIIDHTPKILGPRRARALSIGKPEPEPKLLTEGSTTPTVGAPKAVWKTTTDEQENSLLFKLPWELRRQIFEEVIGGYMIHICFIEKYLPMAHSRCKSEREGKCGCQVFGKGQWRAYQPRVLKQKGAVDEWGQCELLALSKTCRRIYSETIELLYTTNTFDFTSIVEVFRFSLTILPERMRLIKNIQWKHQGIYDSINRKYISGKFYHTKVGEGHDRMCKRTPWLQCRKPEYDECSCLDCWTPDEGLTVEQQRFVVYMWVLRSEDEIFEEYRVKREREQALASARSSRTFDDDED